MASATSTNYASNCWAYVQSTRPYKFMADIGSNIQAGGVKVLDFVLPRNEMTKRREFRFIPVVVENFLGSACYDGVCPKAKISTDRVLTEKVETVFQNLVAKCPRKSMKWEVRVLDDDKTVNAFCLPGGKTVITTGMINKLKEKYEFDKQREFVDLTFEDNIAAVMGHEIVHAAAGHGARRMQLMMSMWVIGKVVSYVIPAFLFKHTEAPKGPETAVARAKREEEARNVENKRSAMRTLVDLVFKLGNYLFSQHHSQCHELESDKYGIWLAHHAKYDIHASERLQNIFLEMKGKKDGDKSSNLEKGLAWLSSHPPSQDRLDANRVTIQTILKDGPEAIFV